MISIRVENVPPGYILDIVKEMRKENIEFTFSYHPSKWTEDYVQIPNYTLFNFTRDKDATYFVLKWKIT